MSSLGLWTEGADGTAGGAYPPAVDSGATWNRRAPVDVLDLDPRHTGANHLSEVALLQHTGSLQWREIAARAGLRMRQLRAPGDRTVYASFYYARIRLPLDRPLSIHRIDDRIGFTTSIRLFGDTLVDGWHRLLTERELDATSRSARRPSRADAPPLDVGGGSWIRMSNVFVAMKDGPSTLEVCSPTNLDPRRFERSPRRFDTYHAIKRVRVAQEFPLPPGRTTTRLGEARLRIPINPDRDINGVGLVYFAKYVTFLDSAERRLLTDLGGPAVAATVVDRSLVEREIAYYANAQADDAVDVLVRATRLGPVPSDPPGAVLMRFDHLARRVSDGRILCVSAATKLLGTRLVRALDAARHSTVDRETERADGRS